MKRKRVPFSFPFWFIGKQYLYSLELDYGIGTMKGVLNRASKGYETNGISNTIKDIGKAEKDYLKELKKIADESFSELKNFIMPSFKGLSEDEFRKQQKELDRRLTNPDLALETAKNIADEGMDKFQRKVKDYALKIKLGTTLSALEEIIEKNNINMEDPEKAVLQALAKAKKQGEKVALRYGYIKELARYLEQRYKGAKAK